MKSLKGILSVLVVVIFTISCSPISDEDITPKVKKDEVQKFEVEKTKGGPGPEGGDPGND